jgi:hypothetical protein
MGGFARFLAHSRRVLPFRYQTAQKSRKRIEFRLPGLEVLEDRTAPSVFTVLNTNDSGPGSLRQAILNANASHRSPRDYQFRDY